MADFLSENVWTWGTPVQWAVLLVVLILAGLLWQGNRRIGRFLSTSETLLGLAKVWYEHGRTQHVDADWQRQQTVAAGLDATRTAVAAAGKVAAVAAKSVAAIQAAVAAAPDATAAKVVELLDQKQSGLSDPELKKPVPPKLFDPDDTGDHPAAK